MAGENEQSLPHKDLEKGIGEHSGPQDLGLSERIFKESSYGIVT